MTTPAISHGGGIFGFAGLCLEFKHGIPSMLSPFAKCDSASDFARTLISLDDATFLGVIFWLALLVVSTALAVRSAWSFGMRLASPLIKAPRPGKEDGPRGADEPKGPA